MKSALCFLALAGSALAAEPVIGGPVTGYVLVQGGVNPVLGIPGAASLGAPILTGVSATAVSTIAGLAFTCDGSNLQRFDFSSAKQVSVATLDACPDAISVSPGGVAAALLYRDLRQVRVLRQGGEATSFDVDPSTSACVVSDDSGLVLCAGEGVWAISAEGSRRILPAGDAGPAAFLRSSRDAIVASRTKLFLLSAGADLTLLADFPGASALAVSGDNRTAIAASAAGKRVGVVQLADHTLTALESPVDPESLMLVNDAGVFQLVSLAPGPAWLVVTGDSAPSLVFVPQREVANE